MQAPENDRCLDRGKLTPLDRLSYEKVLADNLKTFLSELCFTNAGVMMSYIWGNQRGNIEDLLVSSAELCLKPGMLSYAHNATFESDWGSPPHVSIDLVFRHSDLQAFFTVIFDDNAVGVDIDRILFNDALGTPKENLQRFAKALADSRLAHH